MTCLTLLEVKTLCVPGLLGLLQPIRCRVCWTHCHPPASTPHLPCYWFSLAGLLFYSSFYCALTAVCTSHFGIACRPPGIGNLTLWHRRSSHSMTQLNQQCNVFCAHWCLPCVPRSSLGFACPARGADILFLKHDSRIFDSHPTLYQYVVHGRANPVFSGPNSTEPNLYAVFSASGGAP